MKYQKWVSLGFTVETYPTKLKCKCGRVIHPKEKFGVIRERVFGKDALLRRIRRHCFCRTCLMNLINAYRFKLFKIENSLYGGGC